MEGYCNNVLLWLGGSFLSFLCLIVHAWRFKLVCPKRIAFSSIFLSTASSFSTSLFLPLKTNEGVRFLMLKRLGSLGLSDFVVTVLYAQLFDVVVLMLATVLLFAFSGFLPVEPSFMVLALVVGLLLLFTVFLLVFSSVRGWFFQNAQKLRYLATPSILILSLIGTSLTWLLTGLAVGFSMSAAGVESSLLLSFSVLWGIMLAALIPLLPGSFGTFEAAIIMILTLSEQSLSVSALAALYTRVALFLPSVLVTCLGGYGVVRSIVRDGDYLKIAKRRA